VTEILRSNVSFFIKDKEKFFVNRMQFNMIRKLVGYRPT